jgi:hypothetical protein
MKELYKERNITIFLISIIILFICSCSNKRDFKNYLRYTGIELKDSYEIDSITQVGLSDWTLKAYVKISNNDKKRILKTLKTYMKFPQVNSENEYYERYHHKGDSIHGYIIDTKYFYGIFVPRTAKFKDKVDIAGYETYDLELDTTNNELYFIYEYE